MRPTYKYRYAAGTQLQRLPVSSRIRIISLACSHVLIQKVKWINDWCFPLQNLVDFCHLTPLTSSLDLIPRQRAQFASQRAKCLCKSLCLNTTQNVQHDWADGRSKCRYVHEVREVCRQREGMGNWKAAEIMHTHTKTNTHRFIKCAKGCRKKEKDVFVSESLFF